MMLGLSVRNAVNRSLGLRMVLATLGFCFLFALLTISLRSWLAWHANIATMHAELGVIEQVYQRTLTKAIWELDRDSVQMHLDTALKMEAVGKVEIKLSSEAQKQEVFKKSQPNWHAAQFAPQRKLDLSYQVYLGAPIENVGELTLHGNDEVLMKRLMNEVEAIAFTQLVQSLLLAGLIMLMFNSSVTLHVKRIAHHLQALNPANLSLSLFLHRNPKRQDELSLLVTGVNQLQQNLLNYLQQQQIAEHELAEHRDNLAALVQARTLQLSNANQQLAQANGALASSADTLRQLGDIGKELNASLDRQAICTALHRSLAALMPIDAFGVALSEENGATLSLIYYVADGVSVEAKPMSLLAAAEQPYQQSWLRAYSGGEDVVLSEPSLVQAAVLAASSPAPQTAAPLQSAVLRPLIVHSQHIGVVAVYSRQQNAYAERELDILHSISAYAGIALDNAGAYADAEAARQQAANALQNLRQAQSQLVQSEKMAALGQLIAGVAHEINSPIGAVKSSGKNIADALEQTLTGLPNVFQLLNQQQASMFADLIACANLDSEVLSTREERGIVKQLSHELEQAHILNPRHKAGILVQLHANHKLLNFLPLLQHPQADLIFDAALNFGIISSNTANINTAVDRVSKIVFALKSFSRFDYSSQLVMADLRTGIETVLTVYQSQIKHNIELQRDYEDLPLVMCQPDELNQVWTNLIHNAIQAMNQHGSLSIGLHRSGDYAQVIIADSGCGIAPAIREQIFDAFFTTKPAGEGTGLGLDIVKKIIDKHHGRIEVESEVGVGTRFLIYLPFSQVEPSPSHEEI